MTVIFQDKINKEMVTLEDVKWFSTEDEYFGVKGIGIHYKDGTYNIVSSKLFKLAVVKH